MCTMRVVRAFSKRVPVIGETGGFQKIGRTVHGVHILVQHAPHVAALSAQNPLHAEAAGLRVDLGVQPLGHLVGGEEAEVAAFGGIGAVSEVQADLVKERHIAEQRVVMRRGKIVGRRHHEKHFSSLAVDGKIDPDAGDILEFVGGKLQAVFEGVRLDAEMVADAETVGRRLDHPIDVAADQVQQFAARSW